MNSPSYITFNLVGLVLGQWLVTRGHWSGFLVWCACNVYGVIVCFTTGIPETSCLFGAYFLVNAGSLFAWLVKARGSAARVRAASTPTDNTVRQTAP